jgi:hypothetical protein
MNLCFTGDPDFITMNYLPKILLGVSVVTLLVAARQANEANQLQTENTRFQRAAAKLIGPVRPRSYARAPRSKDS